MGKVDSKAISTKPKEEAVGEYVLDRRGEEYPEYYKVDSEGSEAFTEIHIWWEHVFRTFVENVGPATSFDVVFGIGGGP